MTEKTLPTSIETKKKFFTKKRICSILITLFCLCMAVFMLFPMYMIYINSFKNFFQFIIDPLSLPKPWTLKNYEYAVESFNYFRLLLNNLVFESVSLFFIVLLGAMAGYTIARRPSRFKRIIYIYIVMGITLPTYTALYPQIRLISDLGLTDTYAGVIVLYVAAGMPMSIFYSTVISEALLRNWKTRRKLTGVHIIGSFSVSFFRFQSQRAQRSYSCRPSVSGTILRLLR